MKDLYTPKKGKVTSLYQENTAHPLMDCNERLEYYHIKPMIIPLSSENAKIIDMANDIDWHEVDNFGLRWDGVTPIEEIDFPKEYQKFVDLIKLTYSSVYEFIDLHNLRHCFALKECWLKPFEQSDVDNYIKEARKAQSFNIGQCSLMKANLISSGQYESFYEFHQSNDAFHSKLSNTLSKIL
jgi:hypothetical protein